MSNVIKLPVRVRERSCPQCGMPLTLSVQHVGRYYCADCAIYPAIKEPEADAAFRRFRGED